MAKKKLSVKVKDFDSSELPKLAQHTANKIRGYMEARPFTNKIDVMIKLKIPPAFFQNNVFCFSCGYCEPMASYAIAQKAMGHAVTFSCDCGNKINC